MKMPMSRFAMHAISVYSDSPDFIEQEGQKLFTPTTLDPSLHMTWTENVDGVDAADDDGPIISFRSTNPNPVYTRDEMWGQHYNASTCSAAMPASFIRARSSRAWILGGSVAAIAR